MKKTALITNIILLIFVCFSCKRNTPDTVIEKYYTHFCRGEFKEIKDYVVEEQYAFYDKISEIYIVEDKPQVKVTKVKCDITGDTLSVCSCLLQVGDDEPKEQLLTLKKIDNKWLVYQGKEANMFSSEEDNISPVPEEQVPEE
jgi:hypothetical protein